MRGHHGRYARAAPIGGILRSFAGHGAQLAKGKNRQCVQELLTKIHTHTHGPNVVQGLFHGRVEKMTVSQRALAPARQQNYTSVYSSASAKFLYSSGKPESP